MKRTLLVWLSLCMPPLMAAPITPGPSQISFTMQQMHVPVQGQFNKFSGDISLDPANAASGHANLTIQIASIQLPTAEAAAQTQKPVWFDVARFPTAHFCTTSIKPLGGDRFQFSGKLTIKGITREVSAPFTASRQGKITLIDGTLPVSRLAFKIGDGEWRDTDTVADTVQIRFRITVPGHP